jgi:hypothetical protein
MLMLAHGWRNTHRKPTALFATNDGVMGQTGASTCENNTPFVGNRTTQLKAFLHYILADNTPRRAHDSYFNPRFFHGIESYSAKHGTSGTTL